MAQFSWPSLTVSSTNSANGSIGSIAPSSATEVAGVDPSGNLQAIQVTAAKRLIVDNSQVTQPVSGNVAVTNFPATQPISATALPLPTGAATAAKQPALGTAGSASADVITVQGAAGMTAIKTDSSGVTQPVSGTVAVSNLPATQTVSGSVSVANFPATQPVSGSVSVSNLPSTQTVAGSVSVSNFPATQPVSGTISAKTVTATIGTLTQGALTVGQTAVRATVSGAAPATTRTVLVITPDANATGRFYLGSSSVSYTGSARGIQFRAGQTVTINADAADYYIVSDTVGQTVYIMEQV